jgi:hypothetical protein
MGGVIPEEVFGGRVKRRNVAGRRLKSDVDEVAVAMDVSGNNWPRTVAPSRTGVGGCYIITFTDLADGLTGAINHEDRCVRGEALSRGTASTEALFLGSGTYREQIFRFRKFREFGRRDSAERLVEIVPEFLVCIPTRRIPRAFFEVVHAVSCGDPLRPGNIVRIIQQVNTRLPAGGPTETRDL